MRTPRALGRRPSPHLAEGMVTHIDRSPVDLALAVRQWEGYVAALQEAGWSRVEVDAAEDCPDGVFVEGTVVLYGGQVVLANPGAERRRSEVPTPPRRSRSRPTSSAAGRHRGRPSAAGAGPVGLR
jgi:N-dimethylarginine dimethylaminohydrolase